MSKDQKQPIIIKKVKKVAGGAHGGSWKVAYADFVTAMMAFFLLLWLLSMTSPEKKIQLSAYFKDFSIFDSGGRSNVIDHSSALVEVPGQEASATQAVLDKGEIDESEKKQEVSEKDVKEALQKAIEEKLSEVKDQIIVESYEGGVRIQIVDADGNAMFPSGSATPTEQAKKILRVVAENLSKYPNRIAVEGHTDAVPFKGGSITNWELSTARASAARIEMEKFGIPATRVARVVGYADTDLLNPANPLDPRNRRMSIIMLFDKSQTQQAKELQERFKGGK